MLGETSKRVFSMQKKYALISIAVILLVACGVYFKFFYKHIDPDRIEASDSLKILTSNTADMLKTLQGLKGYIVIPCINRNEYSQGPLLQRLVRPAILTRH